MKTLVIQVLESLLILALMTFGFIFVEAFVEYKTLDGANIVAVLFGCVVCSILAAASYLTIKEILKEQ